MKINKNWIAFFIVFSIVLTSIPDYSYAIIAYADYAPTTIQGSGGTYLMVFRQDRISNDVVVDQLLKSRTMRKLPTEFQIEEINDTVIMNIQFTYNESSYFINQTDVVLLNNIAYLFIAAQDMTSNNVTFFVRTSADNGVSWGDLILLYNTTVEYSEDTYYTFDAINRNNELILSYSYGLEVELGNFTTTLTVNDVLEIDPDLLEVTNVVYVPNGFGKDFEFYNYNENLLVIYSEESGLTHTLYFDQLDFNYNVVTNIYSTDAPQNQLSLLKPTVTFWSNRFYIVAQDNLTDEFNIAQGIIFHETYLWGVSFQATYGTFGLQPVTNTITNHIVIKGLDDIDGYYRRDPSLTVYEGRLFLTFIVGRGNRFGGTGNPSVAFAFSADGDTWTNNFLGNYNLFVNLGTYFVIGTVGLFAVIYPSYLVYTKQIKGKK